MIHTHSQQEAGKQPGKIRHIQRHVNPDASYPKARVIRVQCKDREWMFQSFQEAYRYLSDIRNLPDVVDEQVKMFSVDSRGLPEVVVTIKPQYKSTRQDDWIHISMDHSDVPMPNRCEKLMLVSLDPLEEDGRILLEPEAVEATVWKKNGLDDVITLNESGAAHIKNHRETYCSYFKMRLHDLEIAAGCWMVDPETSDPAMAIYDLAIPVKKYPVFKKKWKHHLAWLAKMQLEGKFSSLDNPLDLTDEEAQQILTDFRKSN